MSLDDRARDRLRWDCRRGMLELDLVLNAFLVRHLDGLEPRQLEAFRGLLAYPDPLLLEFVMGHSEPDEAFEREVLTLMRAVDATIAA
jgi:antitoxin CptB